MSDVPPPPGGFGSSQPAGQPPAIQPAGQTPAMLPPAPPPPRADQFESRGPVRLERLGAGQTIDAAIRLYRARWKTLLAISAVIVVPFSLLQQYAIHASRHPVLIGRQVVNRSDSSVVVVFLLLNYVFIQPLIQASLIRAMAGIYLGHDVRAGESLRFGLSKLGWVLLWSFLAGLLTAFGLIALIVGAIFLYVRFYFTVSAVVLEDEKSNPIGRSWNLTKGLWWHIFGTSLLASLIAGIAGIIFAIPTALIAVNDTGQSIAWVFQAVLGAASTVLVTPFTMGVIVLLYFDARIRKEGFDLAVMAREVGAATP